MGRIFALFGPQCCLHGVEVCFLLELADILLVTNPLVAKPIGDLKEISYFSPTFQQFLLSVEGLSEGHFVHGPSDEPERYGCKAKSNTSLLLSRSGVGSYFA